MFLSSLIIVQNIVASNIDQNFDKDKSNVGSFIFKTENGTIKDNIQGSTIAKIDKTDDGSKIRFDDPYDSENTMRTFAGTFKGKLEGSKAKFYCIDISHGLVFDEDYTDEGPTQIEITYILNNYFPYTDAPNALSDEDEAAAVQAVLWHYADGMDLESIDDHKIKERALHIFEDAEENASSVVYPDYFTISPSFRDLVDGETANFGISAFDTDGNPYSGLVVELSSTSGNLSNEEVVTNNNGIASFTLTQDGGNIAVVTATADVIVHQGTQYFHVEDPNGKQKLVLATPTEANSSAMATVNWYTPGDCDIHNYTTYTQGGWGGPNNSDVGRIREEHFHEVFPNGLTIGGNFTITLENSSDVKNFLPSGGTAAALSQNYTNPTSPTSAGILASQLVAPTLNIYFHDAGFLGENETHLGSLVFNGSVFDGMSLYEFLNIANAAIGGTPNPLYSYSEINDAATKLNENFNEGKDNEGDLTCGTGADCNSTLGDYIWHDSNVNGIQDDDESGIENVVVELYDDNSTLLSTTNTDNSGHYEFTDLANGDYVVKVADVNFNVGGVFESIASEKWYLTLANQKCSNDNDDFDNDGIKNSEDDDDDNDGISDDEDNDDDNDGISDDEDEDDDNDGISDNHDRGDDDFDDDGILNGDDDDDDNDGISDDEDNDDDNDGILDVNDDDDDNDGIPDDEDDDNDDNYCDNKDSDSYENNSVNVTIDCSDNYTIDFGFFKTSFTFEKTGPQSIDAGEIINYQFTIVNTGDLVLAGGVTVYDTLINPDGDHSIRHSTVQPGADWNFTASYTATENDCGDLVNNASAIGHPQMPDGTYLENIEAQDNWTVNVICNTNSTLGDRVWFDENENGIQDLGEDGVENVVVNLYTCLDVFVATTTTDDDGFYLFDDITPNSYYVEFVLPNGYLFSSQNVGEDSNIDSDADQNSGKTSCFDLAESQEDLSWDAGIYTQPEENFDLSIEKTSSNTNPEDEELVTYTITVTNNGNVSATGVAVTDILPAGLIYQSSTPVGYDTTTGIWSVGDISAGNSKELNITVKVDFISMSETPIFDLGIAAPYNLFVLKDAVHTSDTQGKVAVGRDATFNSYSVGDKLNPSGGTEDVLIVGRKLTYTTGQVFNGNVVYGKHLDVQQINLVTDGSIRKENPVPIDFNQAGIELNALSSQLATRPITGDTRVESYGIYLTGEEPTLNVFEIDGNDLSATNSVVIDVPNGSVVLVNISRRNVTWFGGLDVTGTADENVLFNFYKARNINISGIKIRGSVLAPKAKVDFDGGYINGQMICKYYNGKPGQVNLNLFHGSIPGNPEITNCAEITAVDQIEENTDNNISCAPIVVNVDYNPNNGNTPNEWVEFGNGGLTEMVWSMYQSSNGLMVGTVGGNIYLNENNDFTLLNDGMNVTYIWTLYEFDGNIYAGTELGLYKYDGANWNKVAIDGDVRAISSLDNTLYVGVWGGGVFASSDNSANWTEMSDGLEMCGNAVHTLTTSDGELFVGTFGLGVLKYDFENSVWIQLPINFDFIWSLATDIDGTIYAGSYGGGAFASVDNGENWTTINAGLPNKYIYSVSTYGDEIFISTWAVGIYRFETGSLGKADSKNPNPSVSSVPVAGTWTSIGLNGFEVSSVMVDEDSQTLYAATSSGAIYKMVDNTVGVEDNKITPTEFALEQNYPNPFNPSTIIEFSIPNAGQYSLKIFNVLGQEVATLMNKEFAPGKYTYNFDASRLTTGIYFYKLVGEKVNLTKKMLLLK
jgi:choice-of-anchor A domain-containing protein/uncharacterized repeat protein (TIGR01451 family)